MLTYVSTGCQVVSVTCQLVPLFRLWPYASKKGAARAHEFLIKSQGTLAGRMSVGGGSRLVINRI